MDLKDKSETLAEKMNRITEKFASNLDSADELVLTGDDIIEYVDEKTMDIELFTENIPASTIVNLNNMVSDFKFVRETLRENTENGRRVLNSVTLDLLDSDDSKRASLITAFAELNKAVADNLKLYIQSYREISNVLVNLDKIRQDNAPKNVTNNNTLNVNTVEPISTSDLIKELKGE